MFQKEDAHRIINRGNERDHHRGYRKGFRAKNVFHQGDAQQHKIAAEQCLQHGASGAIVFLHRTYDHCGNKQHDEQRYHRKYNQPRTQGRRKRRRIHIIKHHAEKEYPEDHRIHML